MAKKKVVTEEETALGKTRFMSVARELLQVETAVSYVQASAHSPVVRRSVEVSLSRNSGAAQWVERIGCIVSQLYGVSVVFPIAKMDRKYYICGRQSLVSAAEDKLAEVFAAVMKTPLPACYRLGVLDTLQGIIEIEHEAITSVGLVENLVDAKNVVVVLGPLARLYLELRRESWSGLTPWIIGVPAWLSATMAPTGVGSGDGREGREQYYEGRNEARDHYNLQSPSRPTVPLYLLPNVKVSIVDASPTIYRDSRPPLPRPAIPPPAAPHPRPIVSLPGYTDIAPFTATSTSSAARILTPSTNSLPSSGSPTSATVVRKGVAIFHTDSSLRRPPVVPEEAPTVKRRKVAGSETIECEPSTSPGALSRSDMEVDATGNVGNDGEDEGEDDGTGLDDVPTLKSSRRSRTRSSKVQPPDHRTALEERMEGVHGQDQEEGEEDEGSDEMARNVRLAGKTNGGDRKVKRCVTGLQELKDISEMCDRVMLGEATLKANLERLSELGIKTDEFVKAMHDRQEQPYQDWSAEEKKYNDPEDARWKAIYENAGLVYNSRERMAFQNYCVEKKAFVTLYLAFPPLTPAGVAPSRSVLTSIYHTTGMLLAKGIDPNLINVTDRVPHKSSATPEAIRKVRERNIYESIPDECHDLILESSEVQFRDRIDKEFGHHHIGVAQGKENSAAVIVEVDRQVAKSDREDGRQLSLLPYELGLLAPGLKYAKWDDETAYVKKYAIIDKSSGQLFALYSTHNHLSQSTYSPLGCKAHHILMGGTEATYNMLVFITTNREPRRSGRSVFLEQVLPPDPKSSNPSSFFAVLHFLWSVRGQEKLDMQRSNGKMVAPELQDREDWTDLSRVRAWDDIPLIVQNFIIRHSLWSTAERPDERTGPLAFYPQKLRWMTILFDACSTWAVLVHLRLRLKVDTVTGLNGIEASVIKATATRLKNATREGSRISSDPETGLGGRQSMPQVAKDNAKRKVKKAADLSDVQLEEQRRAREEFKTQSAATRLKTARDLMEKNEATLQSYMCPLSGRSGTELARSLQNTTLCSPEASHLSVNKSIRHVKMVLARAFYVQLRSPLPSLAYDDVLRVITALGVDLSLHHICIGILGRGLGQRYGPIPDVLATRLLAVREGDSSYEVKLKGPSNEVLAFPLYLPPPPPLDFNGYPERWWTGEMTEEDTEGVARKWTVKERRGIELLLDCDLLKYAPSEIEMEWYQKDDKGLRGRLDGTRKK